MTWTDAGHPLAALLAGLVGALLGWFVPQLIAALPEPEPEGDPESDPESDPLNDPESDPLNDPLNDPENDRGTDAAGEVEKALVPLPPKIPYVDLAGRPGLAGWTALLSAVSAAVIGASVGREWSLVFLVPLVPVCVALAMIDWQTRLLPTRLVLPAHAVAIVVATGVAFADNDTDSLVRALVAMLVVRSIFWVLWWFRSSGMGFGDVRLSALLAFVLGYLGWAELVIGMYAGFVVFIVPGLAVAIVRRNKSFLKTRLPFGPAMIIGALLGVAVGPWIARGLGY